MDQLGIDRFKAIGFSSGGDTLIHMATQQPGRVEAMIMIGSENYFTEEVREFCRRVTAEVPAGAWGDMLRQYHRHGDDQIRALMTHLHSWADSYDDMNFTPPYLSTIRARTLIVAGDHDQIPPISIPVEMYRAISRSYLWIVPNGGHLAPDDHSDKFAALFIDTALEFLSEAWDE